MPRLTFIAFLLWVAAAVGFAEGGHVTSATASTNTTGSGNLSA